MSNIYMTEPPTSGKILLSTSKGDIEIELWAKETPKACRNIIALALEGYFDNMIWHRVVPNFCVQTGDPTGTGTGGESFYGEPFQDEPHQRLKFSRRGLVAMANPGELNHNESQFFITLDATPELQNKHTIFGKVSGPTIFNVLALSEVELSEEEPDRPVFPPKLHTVKVLENPFTDIVPRITREEKLAQENAKRQAKLESGRKREKVKKNTGLLSFGAAEEVEEPADPKYNGGKSSHDLLKNDKRLKRESSQVATPSDSAGPQGTLQNAHASTSETKGAQTERTGAKKQRSSREEPVDLSSIRREHESSQAARDAASQIEELEASIRGLSKRKETTELGKETKARKINRGKQLLEEARQKYTAAAAQSKTARHAVRPEDRERDTMALLRKFQSTGSGSGVPSQRNGSAAATSKSPAQETLIKDEDEDPSEAGMREYGASDEEEERQAGSSWRNHRFDYGGKSVQEDSNTTDNYVTLDPRDTSSSAAADLGFGSADTQKRAREEKRKREGRQGRDYIDERSGWRGRSAQDERSRDSKRSHRDVDRRGVERERR